jgi:hypothetical protein
MPDVPGPESQKARSTMTRITHAMLFSALLPQLEMEERQSLDWGEKFLDSRARSQLLEEFEYQGSNIPLGASEIELARYKHRSTRQQDTRQQEW